MTDREARLEEIEKKFDKELSPFGHEQLKEGDVVFLITEIKQAWAREKVMEEALTEINHQSIAHSDDSLSSEWLNQITREAIAQVEKLK